MHRIHSDPLASAWRPSRIACYWQRGFVRHRAWFFRSTSVRLGGRRITGYDRFARRIHRIVGTQRLDPVDDDRLLLVSENPEHRPAEFGLLEQAAAPGVRDVDEA